MEDSIKFSNDTEVLIRKSGDTIPGRGHCEVIFENGWDYGFSYYIPKEDIDKVIAKLLEVKQLL